MRKKILFEFSIILNGVPRLILEARRFYEDSETLRDFRVMFENYARYLGNTSNVSNNLKTKNVSDKKMLATRTHSGTPMEFSRKFLREDPRNHQTTRPPVKF
jgi:hypothetical protein